MKSTHAVLLFVFLAWPCLAQRPAQGPMSDERYTPEKLGYTLFWEDQFEGDALDPTKWAIRGEGPRGTGRISKEAIEVADGHLTLKAFEKDGEILTGMVGTQGLFETHYGYFECRAQLQRGGGIWAAFWLQSPLVSAGEDPAEFGAEIDIMEFFRKLGTDIVSHNVHWAYGPNQQTTHGMQSYLKGVSEGFHTFALEWTEDSYTFFVDGYKFYEVKQAISHIDQYIILSMEPPQKEEMHKMLLPDEYIIDYVRVFKKDVPEK
ncbi:MAG: family 16 glycosylhydrolase [Candidatus Hydrogenedens sp.]|nr:family 16 glycosylhydrolase [Candidatus Hydrogenedens sp.]